MYHSNMIYDICYQETIMEIIENGKLYDENLRHPISAYYIHGAGDSTGFFDIVFRMFGFSF